MSWQTSCRPPDKLRGTANLASSCACERAPSTSQCRCELVTCMPACWSEDAVVHDCVPCCCLPQAGSRHSPFHSHVCPVAGAVFGRCTAIGGFTGNHLPCIRGGFAGILQKMALQTSIDALSDDILGSIFALLPQGDRCQLHSIHSGNMWPYQMLTMI